MVLFSFLDRMFRRIKVHHSFLVGRGPYVSVLDRKSLDAGFVRFSSRHYDFLVGRAIVVEPLSEWHKIEMCFLFLPVWNRAKGSLRL